VPLPPWRRYRRLMEHPLGSYELVSHCLSFLCGDHPEQLCQTSRVRRMWQEVVASSSLWSRAFAHKWMLRYGELPISSFAATQTDVSFMQLFRVLRDGRSCPSKVDTEAIVDKTLAIDPENLLRVMMGSGSHLGGDRAVRADVAFPAVPGPTSSRDMWHSTFTRHLPFVSMRPTAAAGGGPPTSFKPMLCMAAYFEVEIGHDSRETGGMCAIGYGTKDFRLQRAQPGWRRDSVGYHGDDGHKFHGAGRGEAYGPTFGAGDVVGCILNYHTNEIVFTKNGESLGTAFVCQIFGEPLYPVIGIDTFCPVAFNFGHRQPFAFDIVAYEEAERLRAAAMQGEDHETLAMMLSAALDADPQEDYEHEENSLPESLEPWAQLLENFGSQVHFEWDGPALVVSAGPAATLEHTVHGALSTPAAAALLSGPVQFIEQNGSLRIAPAAPGEGTELGGELDEDTSDTDAGDLHFDSDENDSDEMGYNGELALDDDAT